MKLIFFTFFYYIHFVFCLSFKLQMKLMSKIVKEPNMTIEQLIIRKGFKVEVHFVETQDGYILKLFRILPEVINLNKAVLFQHGLFVLLFNKGLE
jgi:hypothetical protein